MDDVNVDVYPSPSDPSLQPAPGAAWEMQPQSDQSRHAEHAEQECKVKEAHKDDGTLTGDKEAKQGAQRLVDSGYDGGEGQGAVRDAQVFDGLSSA